MTASRIRAHLRQARRRTNLASLTPDDKKQSVKAVVSFVTFGGRKGKGTGGIFADFMKRFPLAKDKVARARRKSGLHHLILQKIAAVKAKLQRRKHNKAARKQRVRA